MICLYMIHPITLRIHTMLFRLQTYVANFNDDRFLVLYQFISKYEDLNNLMTTVLSVKEEYYTMKIMEKKIIPKNILLLILEPDLKVEWGVGLRPENGKLN